MSSAFTIRTLSRSIDHSAMHHLFSPTALDHDLTYVDKTYYASDTPQNFISSSSEDRNANNDAKNINEKQITSGLHAMVLNRTINLVSSISRLDLRNIGLFVLPTQVSQLTKLTLLDLSHNKLVKLPSSMDQLKNLRHLNLSHNNLTQLPSSIYSLTKLNYLDLSHNPFTRVSANLARLVNLNTLDLSNTEIVSIPAELLSLSSTTIKIDNCTKLLERSNELDLYLGHNPLSLLETCARQIIQPVLLELIQNKKKKKLQAIIKQQQNAFKQIPTHLLHYLSRPKACSSCGGPYYQSFVVRYRLVQRQDETWIPVEYKLCSAHWNNEKDRLLMLFSDSLPMSLPSTSEPCHLRLVPSSPA